MTYPSPLQAINQVGLKICKQYHLMFELLKLSTRLEGEGSSLAGQLDHLYAKYGLHTRYMWKYPVKHTHKHK